MNFLLDLSCFVSDPNLQLQCFTQGMVDKGSYLYTDHLISLNSFSSNSRCHLVSHLSLSAYSPLIISQWQQELSDHPDRRYSEYILQGISDGFRIGFNDFHLLQSASSNLPTSDVSIVSDYLTKEVQLNRMWKYPHNIVPNGIHISPVGAIPKKNKPGKYRLIMDLSSPKNFSVNDGIDPLLSSLSYASIDHLSSLILSLGRGAMLVKADIKEAYRMIPIHPQDQWLLGIQWEDHIYIDRMLPFGLRSAPKIFSAVADALQWILSTKGITHSLHYLDDFILVTDSVGKAFMQKDILTSTFDSLGVPLEYSKLEGPHSCLTFLGIEVDTESLQLRLPREKLLRLRSELSRCYDRRSIPKRELQSLTGLLQFATKVIRPGRPFLRRLYAMQDIGSHPDHFIRLNIPARADILWWKLFAEDWNGISMFWDVSNQSAEIQVTSDASGSWGCGAFWESKWFHFSWPTSLQNVPIATKELIPIVVAAAVFGHQWRGHLVEFKVDNMAVVHVLNNTYSKDQHLMHLIRTLVFLAARFDFWFSASHIEGKANILAEALSRNNMPFVFSQAPDFRHFHPPLIPPQLLSLLSDSKLAWISVDWIKLFNSTMQLV